MFRISQRVRLQLGRLATALVLAAIVLAAWGLWWEPRRLVVRQQSLQLPCWNADPLRLALVSDLHVGSPGSGIDKLIRVVEVVNGSQPDAVLLLGDFVIQGVAGGQFVPPEAIAAQLARLRAPLGVYAVLGNHDWWLDGPRVARAFTAVGIPILDHAAIPLRRDRSPVWLAGIADLWEGRPDIAATLARVTDDAPVIAMTHNPDIFPNIASRVCLTVAGHTHGGQVAFPFVGPPMVPSRFGQRYAAGAVEETGRHLFVTTGVGTSIMPVRFRVPPEIALLQIHR